jgi:HPt (histidine-containing phosphotransfer) domain-containing protein
MIIGEETIFDLSYLEEMDDPEFLVQVINLYLIETPKDILEMMQGLNTSDAEVIRKNAHKLKSSTGMLQAQKLLTLLQDIEKILISGKISELLKDKLASINKEYEVLKTALQNHLKSMKTEAA